MRQQHLRIRDKIALSGNAGVLDPPRKAFDAALGLGPLRHFRCDLGQLSALARHDATDECGEGGQVPHTSALGLARIPLYEGLSYGTILPEVVAHGLLLLDWSHSPEGVYRCGNLLSTHFTTTWKSVR